MKLEQQKLQGIIKALEKDIMGLKREIQERDETIQDKVSWLSSFIWAAFTSQALFTMLILT